MMYRKIWDPNVETLTQQELFERLEKPRLLIQLAYVLKDSLFYREKLREFRNARDIIKNFKSIPFTEKKEIIKDQIDFPPFGKNLSVTPDKIVRIHRTSGTTGRPVFIALTKHDIDATIRSGVRCFWASGLRPTDMVFHCLNYCMWMGGFTDHQNMEATGAAVVPYGVGNSKNLIDSILNIKPTAIHCTISYLARLEQLLKNKFKILPRNLRLKKAFLGGEGGVQNPKIRRRIEDLWGFKAMDANYGISDVLSMFGGECYHQNGLHFMGQGNIHAELIDPDSCDNLAIEKGVKGEFVLTNIKREAQPLIRFRTHDVVEILDHNKCSCGRSSFRFKVLGRSDDMMMVKGINIYPSAVGSVISEFLDCTTGEYQIIIKRRESIDRIKILIESNNGITRDKRATLQFAIKKRIKERLNVKSQIELIAKGGLPKTEGKTKRLIKV